MTQQPLPFISRVRIQNYRSIADCDVELEPLTLLVGPNGTGKSNFLQALAFMGRALSTTPQEALTGLGGLPEILRRAPEQTGILSIDIEARLPWGDEQSQTFSYGFEIGVAQRGNLSSFEVRRESCKFTTPDHARQFSVSRGEVVDRGSYRVDHGSLQGVRSIGTDRLYLPIASALQPTIYRELYDRLTSMQFYNFSLDALREPSSEAEGAVLGSSGEHLADVIGALSAVQPQVMNRIDAYLSAISPGIKKVDRLALGGYVTLAFQAQASHGNDETEFGPNAVSDGTLRATGVLAALFQLAAVDGRVPLIALEEPEIALHPAAAGVLFDALTEASERTQILVTTQSPDLLDRSDLNVASVRAVGMSEGITTIGNIDSASRKILSENFYTIGELMRRDQLSPEARTAESRPEREID